MKVNSYRVNTRNGNNFTIIIFHQRLEVLIEIHEISTTIRPIVNWIIVSEYKLRTLTVNNLETYIPLASTSNVKITIQLIDDLLAIPHNKDRNLSLLILSTRIRRFPPKNCSKSSNYCAIKYPC